MSLSHIQTLSAQTVLAVAQGRNLADELALLLAEHPELSPQDKGMLQDIAYGVQRYGFALDALLAQMLAKPPQNAQLIALLKVALYQLWHTRNAPHAVVNEAVRHIGGIARGRYRALANALLRRFQREMPELTTACQRRDSSRYNLPAWWLDVLRRDHPQQWRDIAADCMRHPPLTLRVNLRRYRMEAYLAELAQHGIAAEALDDTAVMLAQAMPVQQIPHFMQGAVSVQDWGAQRAAVLLNPQAGEKVLDACAAPGGKSGHILERADCDLTALDIDPKRLQRVADNLARLGVSARLHCAPAQQLAQWHDGTLFDAVLADVPCTASGTLKRNPDIRHLRRRQDAARTAAQQIPLLDALWRTVRPQGRMLLATCSLFREENQDQCRQFLARHPDAVLHHEEQLLPNARQDGFYYALLYKSVV
ncbi:16S rRNA (cytosine(967)-C(5))-methyltransferase RsmB [Conchiformibius steedae]|uniref:16S rRNA (cytosine(967)-C(5))-methyltransferase RsmB n=1 Tax=Conchiformibius steedae TaxID=153493 RepID=UPI0026EDFB4E|nr:16S rRNA (cytosine(967)-C(5))-methyltransferase RsmB [Conchiformibius steedae]